MLFCSVSFFCFFCFLALQARACVLILSLLVTAVPPLQVVALCNTYTCVRGAHCTNLNTYKETIYEGLANLSAVPAWQVVALCNSVTKGHQVHVSLIHIPACKGHTAPT